MTLKMRKIIVAAMALFLMSGVSFAQDLEQVSSSYNEAAALLNDGDAASALQKFESSLSAALDLGEEGAEIAANCKDIIPQIYLRLGKADAKEGAVDPALDKLRKAVAMAEQFSNNADAVTEANNVIGQLLMNKANGLLNAKDYAAASELYREVSALDPENGQAFLRLGMAMNAAGNFDEAVEAFKKAIGLGQENNANKQLSNMFYKKAAEAQKSKDWKGALEAAQEAVTYLENPSARKVIGTAAKNLNQHQDAIDAFKAYLELSPSAKDKENIIYYIAECFEKLGNKAEALSYYKLLEGSANKQFQDVAKYKLENLK